MSEFLRARQPEQKEERRVHLLATARAMLGDGRDLRGLALNELARRAGMAKSNVYRYFETREAVLIALLWEESAAWYAQMAASYRKPARGRPAFEALVRHVARTLAARPLLCALMAALPSVLELNLSEEAIREVKSRSLESFREIGRFLAGHAPDLSADSWAELLYDAICLVTGLYPFAYPSECSARVASAPEFTLLRRDLERDLSRLLLAVARDRIVTPRRGPTSRGDRR